MTIEWSNSLSSGVEWQDRHHKEMVKRVNSLLDAMSAGMGREEVEKLFRFLDSYFIVHFDAEEQAMNRYNFPGAVEHLEEHTAFIEDISTLKREYLNGSSAGLVIKVQRHVVDWLINHIGGLDKALGSYIINIESERHIRD